MFIEALPLFAIIVVLCVFLTFRELLPLFFKAKTKIEMNKNKMLGGSTNNGNRKMKQNMKRISNGT